MIYFVGDGDNSFPKVSLQKALDYFKDKPLVEVDTETEGFQPHTKNVLCWQIGDYDNQFVINHSNYNLADVKDFFEQDNKTFLFQNAKFDLRFFYKQGVYIKKIYDTYLAEKCLNLGNKGIRMSLDKLIERYCNVYSIDKSIRGQIHYRGLDDIVVDYAANDVKYLSKIRELQLIKARELELDRVIDLENEFSKVLAYIEHCGIYLDKEKWLAKCEKDEVLLNQALVNLNNYIFENNIKKYIDNQLDLFSTKKEVRINWSSSGQVVKLFEHLGIKVPIVKTKNKEGKTVFKKSVEAKHVQKIKHPIIPLYLSYKKIEKVCSTYGRSVLNMILPTGRIHTNFSQIMDTGRLSSGGNDTINMQNIPADHTRECFTASSEDTTLVICDYSAQEGKIFADMTQENSLVEFHTSIGGDIHSFIASKMYEEVNRWDLSKIKAERSDLRQNAKIAGFTIQYGGNGFTISQNLGVPVEVGESVYEDYFKAFPGVKKWFKDTQTNDWKQGYIQYNNVDKRKYFINKDWFEDNKPDSNFWDEWKYAKYNDEKLYEKLREKLKSYKTAESAVERKMLNYKIQGTAASMTKVALILLFNWIIENNYIDVVKIVVPVHDEIVVECPNNLGEIVAENLKKSMEKAGSYYCKLVPMIAEPVISRYWTH